MESFTLTEVSITAVAVIGACGSFIAVFHKSRCQNLSLCYGLISCKRRVPEGIITTELQPETEAQP
tara:strand:- start:67 stop:264 length:198 start_codon:yes stop_codon:yes gene_type:complete